MNRLVRTFIMLPVLLAAWAASNSLGVTQYIEASTGLDIPSAVEIPGLSQIVDIRERVDAETDRVKERARKEAVAALRKEVSKRYGPKAAGLVPADLTTAEATRILKEVASGADLSALKDSLNDAKADDSKGTSTDGPATANGVPYMNQKSYRTALRDLASLPVKGKAPKTGYDRDQFGSSWSDSAGDFPWTRNGLDTRNDVLSRDLVKETCKSGTKSKTGSCKVLTGTLPYDPYSGQKNRPFDASKGTSGDFALDIEHVRALGDLWQHGAQNMTEDERAAVANDPVNLMAVNPSDNRAKGDADIASWLPPNKAYRCAYAARTVAVTKKYTDLWITQAEKDAIKRLLNGCIR